MKDNSVCIKCGGTGIDVLGNPCSCGINKKIEMPVCLKVPMQYQGLRFNKAFVREGLPPLYGETLDKILQECIDSFGQFKRNILICAPPGSSKTIWAYTLYSMLFSMGCEIPEIMDLMQCREILLNYYTEDKEALRLLSTAPLAVIKIPWDLPNRFVETISTIIDRRVRANCSTIFLYNGSKEGAKKYQQFMMGIQNVAPVIKLNYIKVQAHTGVKWNEAVDALANGVVEDELKDTYGGCTDIEVF